MGLGSTIGSFIGNAIAPGVGGAIGGQAGGLLEGLIGKRKAKRSKPPTNAFAQKPAALSGSPNLSQVLAQAQQYLNFSSIIPGVQNPNVMHGGNTLGMG
ncbi:MAG: hypothetical protein VKK59_03055 [Vampirovibrionales bacterium]|nr:hypothetical protein [Vampirovibrionales bacterium]